MYLNANNVTMLDDRALNTKCKQLDFQIKGIAVINVSTFGKFNHLEEINLSSIGIINIPEDLFKFNKQLKKISLYLNRLRKLPKDLLKPLTELQMINLGSNEIEEIDKEFFAANTKLEIIHLEDNKIQSFHNRTFHNLPELKRLWLSFNGLKDFDIACMRSSQKLITFGISCNELTDIKDHEQFREWFPDLRHILICGNNFSNSHLSELKEIFHALEIDIDDFDRRVRTKDLPSSFQKTGQEYIISNEICLYKEYVRIVEKEDGQLSEIYDFP